MYKLLILMLKYIPMLISLVYVLNTAWGLRAVDDSWNYNRIIPVCNIVFIC